MKTTKPAVETYTLTLEPLTDARWRATPLQRLRRLLKSALRAYGLRATRVSVVVDKGEGSEVGPTRHP